MKKSILIFALSTLLIMPGCGMGVGEVLVASSIASSAIKTVSVAWTTVGGLRKCQEGTAYYEYSAETIHRASLSALNELNIAVKTDKPNEDGYYMETGEGKAQFKIKITPVQGNITELKVRINLKSQKEGAELFYRLVSEHIGSVQYDESIRYKQPMSFDKSSH